MRPLRWLIRRSLLVWAAGFVTVAGGVLACRSMPVDILPDLNYPLINIITQIPGASPADVELVVTRPIESALQGSPNLIRLSSVTTLGMSRITCAFSWGTDALAARQVVSSRLAQIQETLPADVIPHIENLGTTLLEVAGYRVTGTQDPMVVEDWVRYVLAPMLRSIPGVANVVIMGGGRRAFRVDADPMQLAAARLTLSDVRAALATSHAFGTGHAINEYGRSFSIQLDGRVRSVQDLGSTVVGSHENGQPIRLAEVASLSEAPLPQTYVTSADGYPAVVFTVLKQPGASTLDICRQVQDTLDARRESFPQGISIKPYYQQSEILTAVFGNLRDNLWMGALMSALVLMLVLGRARITFLLLLALPLSILFAFIWMRWVDLGLNLMTLSALVLVVGMIVDDAVIVVENIVRHADLGQAAFDAVVEGTSEILGADLTGTLTTVAALAPLLMMTGLAGHFSVPFAWSAVGVLTGSLIFSLTVVPIGMLRLLTRRRATSKRSFSDRLLLLCRGLNDLILGRLLQHRRSTILSVTAMFLASGLLLTTNPARGIPELDERTFLVSIILPPGTALPEADRVGADLEQRFLQVPHVVHTTRRTGSPESSYLIEGPNHSEVVVTLEGASAVERAVVRRHLAYILEQTPGVVYRINEPTTEKIDESLAGMPAMFGITLVGPDAGELVEAAGRVEQVAISVAGIVNVMNNTKLPTDTLRLEVDRERAAQFGLAPADIVDQLETALGGRIVTQTVIGERIIPVFLRLQADLRYDPENVLLRTPKGAIIPAAQVITSGRSQTPPEIEHLQGGRSLTMPAEVEGNPLRIMADLRKAIAQLQLPEDIYVTFTGQLPTMIEAGIRLGIVFAVSIVLIFAVMALQFRSLLDPVVVLVKVPIDLMGGALALWITRQPVDITVVLGVVTLAGVSVNNGIVLVDFIRRLRQDGLSLEESIHEAVRVRFRPIILTGLTTIFALVPAAMGWGRGPALLAPLGIFITGGLLIGMIMTMSVLPVLLLSFERFRRSSATVASPSTTTYQT